MKLFKLICVFVFLLSLQACYYDNEEDMYEYYYLDNNCDSISDVKFSVHIQPIIRSKCAIPACHVPGGSGNGNFEIYAEIKAKVDNGSIQHRVINEKTMPPSQPLNSCQLHLLSSWINAGAAYN